MNLFHSLLSQIPSLSYLDYIAPTLGFASGLALYLSSKSRKLITNPEKSNDFDSPIGDCILFSSPTPFNRFVTLRCPSICFPGGELLENVNEKLVEEDTHFVNLNCGRIVQGKSEDDGILEKVAYQRLCVVSEDGGVLSLDWPANLELEEERGLDTTVLIVPGTAEGSYEGKIKRFVCECLRRGVFPVVMNPRGCAGSPLTTPRFLIEKILSFLDRQNKLIVGRCNYFIYVGYLQRLTAMISSQLFSLSTRKDRGQHLWVWAGDMVPIC